MQKPLIFCSAAKLKMVEVLIWGKKNHAVLTLLRQQNQILRWTNWHREISGKSFWSGNYSTNFQAVAKTQIIYARWHFTPRGKLGQGSWGKICGFGLCGRKSNCTWHIHVSAFITVPRGISIFIQPELPSLSCWQSRAFLLPIFLGSVWHRALPKG